MAFLKLRADYGSTDRRLGVLLVTPVVLLIVLVLLIPLFDAISTSFTNLRVPGSPYEVVGLDQYSKLLQDSDFRSSLGRTIVWILANGILQLVLAMIAALALNQKFKGANMVRAWIILPWVVPVAVIAILWRWMLDATSGGINWALQSMNLISQPIIFLGDPNNAFPTLISMNAWRFFPFLTILLLAAMQTIPRSQFEAASMDGASALRQFWTITFAHLRPILAVLGLVGTLWSANIFDLIWLTTKGGPGGRTETMPLFIYETAFSSFNFSLAAAASGLFLLFLMALAIPLGINARKELGRAPIEGVTRGMGGKGGAK
jgi:multiple sugar transport system permease protein